MTVYYFLKAISSIHTEVKVLGIIDDNELWHGEAWELFDHKYDKEVQNARIHSWDYINENGAVSLVIYI